MANPPTPIETKVVVSSWTAVATGMATWVLTTYVPAWHSGVPAQLAGFLPFIVSAFCATAAGYFAKHTPRADEVLKTTLQVFSDPKFLANLEAVSVQHSMPPFDLPGVVLPGPGKPPETEGPVD